MICSVHGAKGELRGTTCKVLYSHMQGIMMGFVLRLVGDVTVKWRVQTETDERNTKLKLGKQH